EGDVGAQSAPIIQDGWVDLRSRTADLFQPAQLAFGLAWRLRPRWLATADLVYERWSAFENPGAAITLQTELRDFMRLVRIPKLPDPQPPKFHDLLALRAGCEHTLATRAGASWLARAGYAFEPSPVPEQFGETNFADGDKHTFAAGLGVEIPSLPGL